VPSHGSILFVFCRESPDCFPENYWPKHKNEFPRISQFARYFLSILPSSAPSERVWSAMGHFLTDMSSHMDAELAIQLLFLNQHAAEFEYYVNHAAIDVPQDEELDKIDEDLAASMHFPH